MATRFTDSEKWSDPWFRRLSPYEKLLFTFLCDNCDWGGFYEVDREAIVFHIGALDGAYNGALDDAFTAISDKVIIVDGWVWVKNFLKHQKNETLNANNPAHKNVVLRIKDQMNRFGGVPEFKSLLENQRGIEWGIKSLIGKGKGNGSGNEYTPKFLEFWEKYPNKTGKGAALSAWKSKGCASVFGDIMASLENHVRSAKWMEEDGKFIPNPATWLNQRRWEDEVEVQKSQYTKDLAA